MQENVNIYKEKKDESSIGSGPANTKSILRTIKGEYTAAVGCSNFKHGNGMYKDWFLPSTDELRSLMVKT